jgi:hypothetical protein
VRACFVVRWLLEQLSTWQASQQIEARDPAAAARAYRAILDNFPSDPVAKFMLKECEKSRVADLLDK